MLGIGLGGVADGVERGIGLGREIRKDRKERKKDKALEGIDADARQTFDRKVAEGTQSADGWDGFYAEYAVPKKAAALLQQGDIDGAESWRKWAETDTARRGSKLFASGMLKGQHGDMRGAIGDFIEAGRVKGYGADYTFSDAVQTDDGGWSVTATGPDGQSHTQTFYSPDEVLQFGATYLNPEAAFEQWRSGQAAASEDSRELAMEREKLGLKTEDALVRKDLGLGTGSSKSSEIAARKQAFTELESSPAFMDADENRQRQMIEQRTQEIMGGGGSAAGQPAGPQPRRVIVDTATGKPVDPATPVPPGSAGASSPMPGLGVQRGAPPAAAPAPSAPTGTQERQQLDLNAEYEQLRLQLQQVDPTSPEALAIGNRMREIELAVRAQR